MVPYQDRSTTMSPWGNERREDYYRLLKALEDIPVLPKEKPHFDRVMKMRNTDGRLVKYSTWKPVRMLAGRDNIGTRNFKKLN